MCWTASLQVYGIIQKKRDREKLPAFPCLDCRDVSNTEVCLFLYCCYCTISLSVVPIGSGTNVMI